MSWPFGRTTKAQHDKSAMHQDELKDLNRKLIKYQLLGFPGYVAIGLGLFGLFGDGGELIPVLGNRNFSAFLITAGTCLGVLEFTRIYPLLKQKSADKKSSGTHR